MGNWGFSTYSPLSKTFVVDKVGDDQPGHRHPHAVDGVDNAVDDDKGDDIPHDLLAKIALAAEHKVLLDGEVDDLADAHCNHVGDEVAEAAAYHHLPRLILHRVAEDIPIEVHPEQVHSDTRPTKVHPCQICEGIGQEQQDKILHHRNQVADNDEQAAFPNPFGRAGVPFGKIIPPIFNSFHQKHTLSQ